MKKIDNKLWKFTEQVNISRIRSGHYPQFLYWRKKFKLLEDEQTDTCRCCSMTPETTTTSSRTALL